jgi:hypothetical protein
LLKAWIAGSIPKIEGKGVKPMQTTSLPTILYRLLHSSGEYLFRDIEQARRQLRMLPGAKLFIIEV